MTGEPVGAVWRLRQSFAVGKPQPAQADPWLQLAIDSPELRASELAVAEANAQYHGALAEILPHADLRYADNFNDSGGSLYGGGAVTSDHTLMLRVTIAVFNGDGQGYSALRERQRLAESKYSYADQKLMVEQTIRNALSEATAGA